MTIPDCPGATDPRAVERLEVCPVCTSRRIDFLLWGKSRYSDLRFRYDRCRDCQAVFVNPRIPESNLTAALGARKHSHLKYLPTREFDTAEAERNLVRPALRMHGGRSDGPLRWLDIGCGIGNLLRAASRQGAVGLGLDADASLIGWARENVPEIHTEVATLERLPFAPPFDIVSADNVLEHIDDCRSFLRRVHEILAEDGLLVLRVPNHRSLFGTLLACTGRLESSFLIDPDAHPINYSRAPLHRLLAETGFEPVRTEEHLMFSYALRRIFRRLDPERWGFLATGSVRLLPVLGWLDRIVPKGGLNVTVFARKR